MLGFSVSNDLCRGSVRRVPTPDASPSLINLGPGDVLIVS